ncbi:MAG: hypothetical protein CFH06_00289 [Alphaproteobacteria bacterium MarineAlpha3_Bin5]|nr:hypothetical protein [Magnetovibrio sp.]PPR79652.1 MAG: hypothetical protein CFH06_00289 [Alphaproteobacteria bacterium MarineAlpha3_Bin5]
MSETDPIQQQKITTYIWYAVILVCLTIVAFPTIMLVCVGMVPTAIATFIDRTEDKYSVYCIAGGNFCGVFVYLLELWGSHNNISAANTIFSEIFPLLIMYASAGFGLIIFMVLPPIISSVLQAIAQRRLNLLRVVQTKLVEEWGETLIPADPSTEKLAVDTKPE